MVTSSESLLGVEGLDVPGLEREGERERKRERERDRERERGREIEREKVENVRREIQIHIEYPFQQAVLVSFVSAF